MIRKTTRIALAAAATFAASLGPAALAQASVRCQPHGSHTITQNSSVRVYSKNHMAYACYKGSGKTTLLQNADPSSDKFAVGGKWVGWSSSDATDSSVLPHSIITVMRTSDRFVNDRWYPGQLNETIRKIVVLSDGAAAWAMTPEPGGDGSFTQVQGTDRAGHPADQFSDDHTDLVGSSLHLISGKTIGWKYTDGTTGTQVLF
jgi:hypothetical protein